MFTTALSGLGLDSLPPGPLAYWCDLLTLLPPPRPLIWKDMGVDVPCLKSARDPALNPGLDTVVPVIWSE